MRRKRRNDWSYKLIEQTSTKENKTWHDWVGKVIHRELCKKLNFDPLILSRKQDLVIINKYKSELDL